MTNPAPSSPAPGPPAPPPGAARRKLHIEPRFWVRLALVSSFSGALFSFLFSLIVILAGHTGLPLVASFERAGGDIAMKLYVEHRALAEHLSGSGGASASGPAGASAGRPTRYLFIDADVAACRQFTPDRGCTAASPLSQAMVVDFLRAAQEAQPRVIMIDWLPPDAAERQAFLEAARRLAAPLPHVNGPWIIAPAESRSAAVAGDLIQETGDEAQFDIDDDSRLRLASVAGLADPESKDGVVRTYPVFTLFNGRPLPTAPFLAAMLSTPDSEAVRAADCKLYPKAFCRRYPRTPSARFQSLWSLGGDIGVRNRVFFTFPPDAGPVAQDPGLGSADPYAHQPASRYLRNGHFVFAPGELQDRVVIFGSTSPFAEDLHPTPVGYMSGAGIILSATRAFAEFAPIKPQDTAFADVFGSELVELLRSVCVGGVIVFLFGWLVIRWLYRKPLRAWPARLLRAGFAGGWFALVLLAALFADLYVTVAGLRGQVASGALINGAVPILSLGLEAYSHAAEMVLTGLDHVAVWLLLVAAPWLFRRARRILEIVLAWIEARIGVETSGPADSTNQERDG